MTWKDIPQNAEGLIEWRSRVQSVYYRSASDGTAWKPRSLAHLGAARLLELAAEYKADFALTTHDRPVSLPVAYQNASYVVYDLTIAPRD